MGFFIQIQSFKLKQNLLLKRLIYILFVFFSSCADETTVDNTVPKGTYIAFEGLKLRSGNTHQGDGEDYIVQTFRILAFNGSGECVSNAHYSASLSEVIQHPIELGTYDFVFLANEPDNAGIKYKLDNLSYYNELNDIAFPASAFVSDALIPMMQEIKDVEVLTGGSAKIAGTGVSTPIPLQLDRIGARIDVLLKAPEDLDAIFTGVTFSNLPDKVPLTANYNGTVNRNLTRSFTLTGNSEYFSDTLVVESGIVWAKKVARIIVPSNEFTPVSNKNNATVFTVNLDGKYNPYCELKIASSDYSIPRNTKLDLLGTVKMPLDMNIKAAPWVESKNNWTPDNRILNVSQIEAEITDFNGVRISFSSNMPKVRVLESVYVGDIGTVTDVTNKIFNDLAITDGTNKTNRFSYDPATGSGYMDVLVDGVNAIGNYTYRLVLSAEDENGNNQLQREIKIKITQNGTRPNFVTWDPRYTGVFFRNNEVGERVISGQHSSELLWEARVTSGSDFITLSTTPSFDPGIGTNNPGDPELFPVTGNQYKNEDGTSVKGKGRIYFRVGTKGTNTGMPRYGTIAIDSQQDGWWIRNMIVYVRQGEEADYIWRPGDAIPDGPISGESRSAARKFSPYNLTAPALKNGSNATHQQVGINGAVFVDYPSQTGAYFQWGFLKESPAFEDSVRLAFHPTATVNLNTWPLRNFATSPTWNPPTGYAYKTECEVCPNGYYRPSDGYTDQKAFNGPYPSIEGSPDPPGDYSQQIVHSTFRVSLLQVPQAGNGTSTYPPSRELPGTLLGYYADGFFDRRPIDISLKAVSTNNANIAFIGVLYYNLSTNASMFLPSSGRRNNNTAKLEYRSDAGYFWSSSTAPWYPTIKFGVWGFESSYYKMQTVASLGSFGFSIRCVTD